LLSSTTPGGFVVDPVVETHTGGLPRPVDASYRGADYDFISAITGRGMDGSTSIQYTLDTRRARTEVTAQRTQPALLRNLITSASNDTNPDPKIGQTLFQLVVPVELEPYFAGSSEMQIELDGGTAGIPWELLDAGRDVGTGSPGVTFTTGAPGTEPWAIRAKLLRKLRVADAPVRQDAGVEGSALVIGEPKCDPDRYPRLFGARDEARQVTQALTGALSRDRVTALISPADPSQFGPDAPAVLNALFDRDHTWRIVHITGHGEPTTASQPGGVVLSQGFLSAAEISGLRVVPELVFVNCCYLAARTGDQLLAGTYDRASFAASVADELIRIGVRCVIAAGWAVDDAAAAMFATTFYTSLLQNRKRFLDAVGDARKAAYACRGNTWAAYQCYGDPDWTFHRDPADPQRPSLADEYRSVLSLSDLVRALETLRIQSQFQGAAPPTQRDKIRYLADTTRRSAEHWLHSGQVAEAFARAALAADDPVGAAQWFEVALAAEDATASLKAAEDYWNLRSRLAAERFADGNIGADEARAQITLAINSLQRLIALDQTAEREDLCGSAYKRLALVEAAAHRPDAETAAIAEMEAHYAAAQARSTREARFYPALNRLAAQLALHAGTSAMTALDPAIVLAVEGSLEATRDDRDFFSASAGIELRIYQAVATGTLAAIVDGTIAEFATLHDRVRTTHWWKSVKDTAEFVLAKYRPRAPAGEQAAVDTLLNQLADWATTQSPAMPAPAAVRTEPLAPRRTPRKTKK
jgi:hypothetical protein